MIILLPHTRRIGYRAKRKPSWKALREFVNEQLRKEIKQVSACPASAEKWNEWCRIKESRQ